MTYPGIRLKLYNYSTPQAIDAVKVENRLCYCFNSSFRGITTQTDYAAAFSGNPCRWYNFYRTRLPGIISRRIKKLSADFAWT